MTPKKNGKMKKKKQKKYAKCLKNQKYLKNPESEKTIVKNKKSRIFKVNFSQL